VVVPCSDSDSCPAGLACMALPDGGTGCTAACKDPADCLAVPTLGSSFTCQLGLCLPKAASGTAPPAPLAELCLSGIYDPQLGRCVSPAGWACDDASQCQSLSCVLDEIPRAGSVVRSGHCS
jgi:hypothetical protein